MHTVSHVYILDNVWRRLSNDCYERQIKPINALTVRYYVRVEKGDQCYNSKNVCFEESIAALE